MGSPLCTMKPGITRWKGTTSYSGLPWTFCPVLGLVQSLFPVARPMKLSTALGALSGNSSHFISPTVVCRMAWGVLAEVVEAAAAFAGAFFVCGDAVGVAVCPAPARLKVSTIKEVRTSIRLSYKSNWILIQLDIKDGDQEEVKLSRIAGVSESRSAGRAGVSGSPAATLLG